MKPIYIVVETGYPLAMTDKRALHSPSRPDPKLKKKAYHHGDLQAATIKAALKIIAKSGPRGFTLSQAAKLAGVSVGAPYRHFANKEALLGAIAAQGFADLCSRLQMASQGEPLSPRDRLITFAITYVDFALERPSQFQVMFDSTVHRRKDPAVDASSQRAFQILMEAVQAALEKQDLRSQESLAAAAWAMMHGHAIFAIDQAFANMGFKTHPETLVRDSFELLLAGVSRN